MMPWRAFGPPTRLQQEWAAQQGKCRVKALPYSEHCQGAPAGGPLLRGGAPYLLQQTRYGNLGRNINRSYYANLSRQRRKARGG